MPFMGGMETSYVTIKQQQWQWMMKRADPLVVLLHAALLVGSSGRLSSYLLILSIIHCLRVS
ncbi:hypothetical protein KSX_68870 [Ktedonospora formicarum]|uniref:Uncharacterized protein n=1 Tax=Ktedonospora formicarum TaxID=2778364 RepID=A0A8J3IAZ0_9CHLR|nr:hypothetical protein KSX_68870 [Ktedonospora formicarum]